MESNVAFQVSAAQGPISRAFAPSLKLQVDSLEVVMGIAPVSLPVKGLQEFCYVVFYSGPFGCRGGTQRQGHDG